MENLLFDLQAVGFSLLLNGLLCLGAWRLAGMGSERPGRAGVGLSAFDRLTVMLSVIVAAVPLITVGLGALGVLGRPGALVAVVVFAVCAWLASRRFGHGGFIGRLVNETLSALGSDRWLVVAILPGVVALLMLFGWALPRPPYGFDPLNYHLPLAAEVIRSGGLMPFHFPPYFEAFPYFTMTGDMFSVWAMLSTGDTSLLPLANIAPFALLAVVFYGFLREYLPSRAATAAVVSALLTVPAFFVLLNDAYVELPLWAFMFGSLRLIVLSARNGHHRGLFVLASLLCGSMIGAKLTGIPMSLVLLAAWIAMSRGRGFRWHAGRFGLFVAGVLLSGSYFYIRNIVLTGSPVYPFPFSIGPVQIFAGDADHAARVGGTTIRRFFAPLVFSGEMFKALFGTRQAPNSSWGLGATGYFFVISAMLSSPGIVSAARRRSADDGSPVAGRSGAWLGPVFLGASLLAGLVYVNLPWCAPYLYGNVRFVYPAIPFAAFALFSMPAIARVKRWFIVLFALALQALSFVATYIPVTPAGLALAAAVLLIGFLVVLAFRRGICRRLTRWLPAAFMFLTIVLVVATKMDTVEAYARPASAAGPARWATERADCLAALDELVPAGPFALTMARGAPHAWFIFPLYGERLERNPVYIDISPGGRDGCLKCADAWPGWPDADKNLWLSGLESADVDALVIMNDDEDVQVGRTPVESTWVRENPELFVPVHTGRFCSVFKLGAFDKPVTTAAPQAGTTDETGM